MPIMELSHQALIDTTYASLGSVEITEFEDLRPDGEKEKGKTATNSLSAQVWSGATNPDMVVFFQSVLSDEARRTRLFGESEPAEFELSGEILSMKVDRKATIVRYISFIPLLIGTIVSDPDDQTPLWLGLAGSLALGALEFPQLSATVHYRAVLTRNGIRVFEKDMQITKRKRYWGYTEWGWKSVSEKGGSLLDVTITESVADLFKAIEADLSGGTNPE